LRCLGGAVARLVIVLRTGPNPRATGVNPLKAGYGRLTASVDGIDVVHELGGNRC
jgi:hypothetical protein